MRPPTRSRRQTVTWDWTTALTLAASLTIGLILRILFRRQVLTEDDRELLRSWLLKFMIFYILACLTGYGLRKLGVRELYGQRLDRTEPAPIPEPPKIKPPSPDGTGQDGK